MVHTLVNSAKGELLKTNAVTLRKFAAITKLAEDVTAADLAEQRVREHEGQQALVDKKAAEDTV